MSTYDNAPPLDGWHVQPAKHCGLICVDFACPVCGEKVPQPDCVLGENWHKRLPLVQGRGMSDDDRLADYLARMDNPDHIRTLPDGCTCGLSLVACNAARYLADVDTRCCPACHHS